MNVQRFSSEHSLDSVLHVLADRYRRRLLVALLDHNPQDDDDIQVPADITVEDEKRGVLRTQMVHVHLPKLEDMEFIEWDRDAHEVRKGPQFEEIRPLLELMRDHADELPVSGSEPCQ